MIKTACMVKSLITFYVMPAFQVTPDTLAMGIPPMAHRGLE